MYKTVTEDTALLEHDKKIAELTKNYIDNKTAAFELIDVDDSTIQALNSIGVNIT